MAQKPETWIPIRPNGDARGHRLPISKATIYRLGREGILTIRKMQTELGSAQRRAAVMQSEIDGIIAMLKGNNNVHH